MTSCFVLAMDDVTRLLSAIAVAVVSPSFVNPVRVAILSGPLWANVTYLHNGQRYEFEHMIQLKPKEHKTARLGAGYSCRDSHKAAKRKIKFQASRKSRKST